MTTSTTTILTDDEIITYIRNGIAEADSNQLAHIYTTLFGGTCTATDGGYVYDYTLEDDTK